MEGVEGYVVVANVNSTKECVIGGATDAVERAMEVLARALIDQDRGPEAVTYARRIVEKRRKRVPYRLLLGDALLMVGDASGARREWQAAAALAPNSREVKQRLQ